MRRFLLTAIIFAVLSGASFAVEIEPLAISNAALGGGPLNAYTPGVTDGTGLNNIGLLVRIWGSVTYIDTSGSFFYIDDGSGANDRSGFMGVRVSYSDLAPGNSFTPPSRVGQYVAITGISSTTAITLPDSSNRIIPTLMPRRSADMVTLVP